MLHDIWLLHGSGADPCRALENVLYCHKGQRCAQQSAQPTSCPQRSEASTAVPASRPEGQRFRRQCRFPGHRLRGKFPGPGQRFRGQCWFPGLKGKDFAGNARFQTSRAKISRAMPDPCLGLKPWSLCRVQGLAAFSSLLSEPNVDKHFLKYAQKGRL